MTNSPSSCDGQPHSAPSKISEIIYFLIIKAIFSSQMVLEPLVVKKWQYSLQL